MALFNCYECGREVSTSAASCPSCGARINTGGSGGDIMDRFYMVCPYCGRPSIAIKTVRTSDGRMVNKCSCGGVWGA